MIPLTQLKVLRLKFRSGSLPMPISSHTLTSLSLAGYDHAWELERDSIHFPLLEMLSLQISYAAQFMASIVAPKLEYFECSTSWTQRDQSGLAEFCELGDKFYHVTEFVLISLTSRLMQMLHNFVVYFPVYVMPVSMWEI